MKDMLTFIVNTHESNLLGALYSVPCYFLYLLIIFSSNHANITRYFPFPFKMKINKAVLIPEAPMDGGGDWNIAEKGKQWWRLLLQTPV